MIGDASADAGFAGALETAPHSELRQAAEQGDNGRISLALHNARGELVAGLESSTSYGWLHVNMLWVTAEKRKTGLGRALMARAFALALKRGCHACWLDTSSPQARAFYEHLGFAVFASLNNGPDQCPSAHERWFLRCALTLAPDKPEST